MLKEALIANSMVHRPLIQYLLFWLFPVVCPHICVNFVQVSGSQTASTPPILVWDDTPWEVSITCTMSHSCREGCKSVQSTFMGMEFVVEVHIRIKNEKFFYFKIVTLSTVHALLLAGECSHLIHVTRWWINAWRLMK